MFIAHTYIENEMFHVSGYHEEDQLFDREMMLAEDFQRTYRYLSILDSQKADMDSEKECLKVLLRY